MPEQSASIVTLDDLEAVQNDLAANSTRLKALVRACRKADVDAVEVAGLVGALEGLGAIDRFIQRAVKKVAER